MVLHEKSAEIALLSQEGSTTEGRARGGSKAITLRRVALEPPRRFAPPLLTQEGNFSFVRVFTPTAN
jgi:hypothetical protein